MITLEKLPSLMTHSHVDLLFFLILMDLRNPIRVNQLKKSHQLIKERLIRQNPQNKESEIVKAIEKMNNHEENVRMIVFNTRGIVPYCMDLNIKLLKNTSDIPFITSDNPLIKYNQFLEKRNWNYGGHNGYGTIGVQMFFPLNEKYMLILFDPNVYKVGNSKEKVVEINESESVDQLNILQYLNCSENLFFNHRITKIYIDSLIERSSKFKKANETYLKPFKVDDGKGGTKQNEEVIKIGTTDLKIKLNLQKVKYSSKSVGIKLDNCAVQFRPKAEEIYRHNESKEKN